MDVFSVSHEALQWMKIVIQTSSCTIYSKHILGNVYACMLSHVWLCNLMDCSQPDSFVHGNFQARILEWIAISFSRESPWPRDRMQVSFTAGGFFTIWATREADEKSSHLPKAFKRATISCRVSWKPLDGLFSGSFWISFSENNIFRAVPKPWV